MIELFKKVQFLLCLFQKIWTLIFVYFWPHAKSQKNLVHKYPVRDRQRDNQTAKKQTSYRTTTLQADPINQVDHDFFWKDCLQIFSSLLPAPLIFGRIPKCFDSWTFLSFWVLVLNPTPHMYTLRYTIQ